MSFPAHLHNAYKNWHKTEFQDRKGQFETLISDGQHPLAMVISCCYSRVHVTDMLGAREGDFFIHRNIANFVPAYQPQGDSHGTAAAVEYAVTALGVQHIMVVGHSMCGGVRGCFDVHKGQNDALDNPASFVGRWVKMMRPSFDAIAGTDKEADIHEMERANVLVSLSHLRDFPFVKQALDKGELQLHGLWHDIAAGALHLYDDDTAHFVAL